MRILYQLNQLGYGGTERVVLSLARHGIHHGHDIAIYCSSDIGTPNYHRRKLWSFLNAQARKRFTTRYVDSMVRLEEAERLVGTNLLKGFGRSGFEAAVKKFAPEVIHFNRGLEDDFYTDQRCNFYGSKILETNIFGNSSDAHYLKRVNRVVFISDWLRSKSSSWSQNMSAATIYNPIEAPAGGTQPTLRARLKIPKNRIVIGRICRPDLDDGTFVLSVVGALRKKLPAIQIHFILMGTPKRRSDSQGDTANVYSLPPSSKQEEVEDFYSAIDILLHYRLEGETFGMVIAEAMIRGIPVVSHFSLVDNAQAELLLSHGSAGIVIDQPTVKDFCLALTYLIENPELRVALGQEGSEIAKRLFEEGVVTKKYFQNYEEIIS